MCFLSRIFAHEPTNHDDDEKHLLLSAGIDLDVGVLWR